MNYDDNVRIFDALDDVKLKVLAESNLRASYVDKIFKPLRDELVSVSNRLCAERARASGH